MVLSTRVLHLLGREGPRTLQPSKYIRFIYNRVALEQPPVRAGSLCSASLSSPPPATASILYYTILVLYYTVQCSRSLCMFVLVAALSSLAKFGASCPDLLNSVLILLQRYEYEYDYKYEYEIYCECVFAFDCKCKQISCIHYTRLADR